MATIVASATRRVHPPCHGALADGISRVVPFADPIGLGRIISSISYRTAQGEQDEWVERRGRIPVQVLLCSLFEIQLAW